jgi:hypothetical protein
MYGDWGATTANITLGIISVVIDNIPVLVLGYVSGIDVHFLVNS